MNRLPLTLLAVVLAASAFASEWGWGPLKFGPRDYRYAALKLTPAQIEGYEREHAIVMKRLDEESEKNRPQGTTIGREAIQWMKQERAIVSKLDKILSSAQLKLAAQINEDYELPSEVGNVRLSSAQLAKLKAVNARFEKDLRRSLILPSFLSARESMAFHSDYSKRSQTRLYDAVINILTPTQRKQVKPSEYRKLLSDLTARETSVVGITLGRLWHYNLTEAQMRAIQKELRPLEPELERMDEERRLAANNRTSLPADFRTRRSLLRTRVDALVLNILTPTQRTRFELERNNP